MKDEINSLDEIHKGACMGMDAISVIKDKVDKDGLREEIEREYNEYEEVAKEIEEIYPDYNEGKPHETTAINKMATWSGVEMRTMTDDSDSKLAELLVTGVNMGIIEGRRILNNKKLNKEVEKIVEKYVTMQEKNLDNLKKYL